ncbi:DUF5522 domain-containing protein [Fulvitalea axinellae]|uniref:DUF5522 domain-containing protein n=1 Tax=Fulvitalea axinellae TaxID=1182444 RepID=UPI0030CA48B8
MAKIIINNKELKEGIHYYLDERGRCVFTRQYHLERGHCCKPRKENKCRHCPWKENMKESKDSFILFS